MTTPESMVRVETTQLIASVGADGAVTITPKVVRQWVPAPKQEAQRTNNG